MSNSKTVSVVVPCFNEERNIAAVYRNIHDSLIPGTAICEIIFVNDGSTDDTLKELETICASDHQVRVLSSKRNRGYGFTVRKGLLQAKNEYIFYIDGDRQYDFSDYKKMLSVLEGGIDLVGGVRENRQDSGKRKILARIGNALTHSLFRINSIRDVDCGFKGIKREALKKLKLRSRSGLTFSLELYLDALKNGLAIIQVPVGHSHRKHGASKGVNARQYFAAVRDVLINFPHWSRYRRA